MRFAIGSSKTLQGQKKSTQTLYFARKVRLKKISILIHRMKMFLTWIFIATYLTISIIFVVGGQKTIPFVSTKPFAWDGYRLLSTVTWFFLLIARLTTQNIVSLSTRTSYIWLRRQY